MKQIELPPRGLETLFGVHDQNIKYLESLLDVRISRAISLRGVGRIELLLDVLNALNDTAGDGLVTDNLFSTNFGRPTSYMDPRRAMVGVRLNMGR